MKKLLFLLLALALLCVLDPAALAIREDAQIAADLLNALGLFKGVGTNPDGTPIYVCPPHKTQKRKQAAPCRALTGCRLLASKGGTPLHPF